MINAYKLAISWRYLMIIPSAILFIMFWSLFIFGGGSLDMPIGAWMLMIFVSGFTGWIIYGAQISKIATSPDGIESVMLGIRVKAAWDKIEKIDMAPDGFVNLVFKEPIYKGEFANAFLGLLGYHKIIQLSPFIDDLATSILLRDLAKYVPNSNIPEFVAQQKHSTKPYQQAGIIGLYYLAWFITWALFAILFQKKAEQYLATIGLPNIDPFLTFVGFSLVIGLFVNAMSLLKGYSAEILKLDPNEASHKARTYYLSPLVIILISFLAGIGIWTFIKTRSDTNFEVLIMFLIGAASLWVSARIERLVFRDNV
jgi:hypothetical protein